MTEKLKMAIAEQLDDWFPQLCWAALCAWAVCDYIPFSESITDALRDGAQCSQGTCWCGKFVNGKLQPMEE